MTKSICYNKVIQSFQEKTIVNKPYDSRYFLCSSIGKAR